MSRARAAATALVLCTALAVAACGGSPISKAEYVRKGNALCTAGNRRIATASKKVDLTSPVAVAKLLSDVGAAAVALEDELTVDSLAGALNALLKDPARLSRMSEAARKVAQPDAAEKLADLVEKTAALAPVA